MAEQISVKWSYLKKPWLI